MKQNSFVERLLASLKGGDEAKLARFDGKLQKYFKKQIAMRQDEIESLTDKIADAQEQLSDVVLNVSLEEISSTEGAESYCQKYVSKVKAASDKVEELEEKVLNLKEEIAEFEKLIEIIYGKQA